MVELEQSGHGASSCAADLLERPFPPAPWLFRGGAWVGLFHANCPVPLSRGVTPLLGPRWIVVALNRYLDGTLRSNELIIGQIARIGWRIGLYIPHTWVDDLASLAGGRRIWGLPKLIASFEWQGADVKIVDEPGLITALRLNRQTAILPRLPLVAPAFGCLAGTWMTFAAYGQALRSRATTCDGVVRALSVSMTYSSNARCRSEAFLSRRAVTAAPRERWKLRDSVACCTAVQKSCGGGV